MIAGLYVPGDSLMHRLGAAVKLGGLFLIGVSLVVVDNIVVMGLAVVATALIFCVLAELGLTRLWITTRPLLVWLAFIAVAQLWFADAESAALIALRLILLVWIAALVTYTTRLIDMTQVISKLCGVLRPLGVNPERVAFLIALTIRLIPAVFDIIREVREVQKARGLERSFTAAFVPVLTRLLRQADDLSEVLVARGFEHWDDAP